MNLELYPQAVCLLLFRKTDSGIKVLACSRKDDLDNWGLPGGKVDEGEDLKQAALREFEEETGILLLMGKRNPSANGKDLITPVYPGICGKFICTTFIYSGEVSLPIGIESLDDLEGYQPKGEGVLSWKTPQFLAQNGAFYFYNFHLFRHMGFLGVF